MSKSFPRTSGSKLAGVLSTHCIMRRASSSACVNLLAWVFRGLF